PWRCRHRYRGAHCGAECQFVQAHVGLFACEPAQHAGEQTQILALAQHQHHRVEVAGEVADAQHGQATSMTSVAWQSSSVPTAGPPSGTSTSRTRAHSSLTSFTTSAVTRPT